jgi:hypothetical protein
VTSSYVFWGAVGVLVVSGLYFGIPLGRSDSRSLPLVHDDDLDIPPPPRPRRPPSSPPPPPPTYTSPSRELDLRAEPHDVPPPPPPRPGPFERSSTDGYRIDENGKVINLDAPYAEMLCGYKRLIRVYDPEGSKPYRLDKRGNAVRVHLLRFGPFSGDGSTRDDDGEAVSVVQVFKQANDDGNGNRVYLTKPNEYGTYRYTISRFGTVVKWEYLESRPVDQPPPPRPTVTVEVVRDEPPKPPPPKASPPAPKALPPGQTS